MDIDLKFFIFLIAIIIFTGIFLSEVLKSNHKQHLIWGMENVRNGR